MRIDKFEGDLFWDDDDPESIVDDPEERLEEIGHYQVVTFQQAQSLPKFYGIEYYDPEKGEYVNEFFTTLEEAEAIREARGDVDRTTKG